MVDDPAQEFYQDEPALKADVESFESGYAPGATSAPEVEEAVVNPGGAIHSSDEGLTNLSAFEVNTLAALGDIENLDGKMIEVNSTTGDIRITNAEGTVSMIEADMGEAEGATGEWVKVVDDGKLLEDGIKALELQDQVTKKLLDVAYEQQQSQLGLMDNKILAMIVAILKAAFSGNVSGNNMQDIAMNLMPHIKDVLEEDEAKNENKGADAEVADTNVVAEVETVEEEALEGVDLEGFEHAGGDDLTEDGAPSNPDVASNEVGMEEKPKVFDVIMHTPI